MINIKYLNEFNNLDNKKDKRIEFVSKYGYAIPTVEALSEIKKLSPIVEIGAGNAYWGYLLEQIGCEIITYDDYSWFGKTILKAENFYTKVHKGNYKSIKKHRKSTLLLIWPPPDDDMAYKCLKEYKGKYFILVGEDFQGCTANDKFYNYLYKHFRKIKTIKLPNWQNFYDELMFFEKF